MGDFPRAVQDPTARPTVLADSGGLGFPISMSGQAKKRADWL